ncbi:HesB/YadR/YfhF family protein [Bacillus tuaregi]|uniref:HesB/YadR/YfhF family protein n=1 Tax=Bacillus tuaregi TaxID=1816695 RepID=UPI0008F82501|nr:HesB/YadR/YfhF family protein [Bacillus tuaregi]
MNISVSNEALEWYMNELDLKEGDFIRFYARYGGSSQIQKGFSLGISTESPDIFGTKVTINGITFYIEEKDLWYFDGHNLEIEYNSVLKEPEFRFSK